MAQILLPVIFIGTNLLPVTFAAAPTSAKLNHTEEAGGTFFRNVETNVSYTFYYSGRSVV